MSSTTKHITLQKIFTWMMEDGIINKEKAKVAFNHARGIQKSADTPMHPLVAVAQIKLYSAIRPDLLLTLDWLSEWAAMKMRIPFYRIDPLKIDFTRVSNVMSSHYAAKFGVLPVDANKDDIIVAVSDMNNQEWMQEVSRIQNKTIKVVFANPLDIAQYTTQFFALAKSIKSAKKLGGGDSALQSNFEQLVEMGKTNKQVDANDQHVINIVDWLWQFAFDQRASDIHLEPKRDAGVIRFRIDGVLHNVYQVPPIVMIAMTARIKLLGRMDIIEKRRPQDGRIKTRTTTGQEVELRLSTMPTAFGEKLVMRIFDPEVVVKTMPELGFPPFEAHRWDSLTKKPHGIILVTGPTGSGKTTTLYTTLKSLATSDVNVCTVEDPIEMVENSFNQMQVVHGIDLSFADGIRALMRQDPDIIMVGEIRDLETAEMAIQAALTGHLVLSTLHTNDAPSAIMRLLQLGAPYYLLESTIIGILAQRLVRTLCAACKKNDGQILDKDWETLVGDWPIIKPSQVFRPVGCNECRNTGYRGRTGIYELLQISQEFSKKITDDTDIHDLRDQAIKDDMKPLRIAGAHKIMDGVTTIEEVLKVTSNLF